MTARTQFSPWLLLLSLAPSVALAAPQAFGCQATSDSHAFLALGGMVLVRTVFRRLRSKINRKK